MTHTMLNLSIYTLTLLVKDPLRLVHLYGCYDAAHRRVWPGTSEQLAVGMEHYGNPLHYSRTTPYSLGSKRTLKDKLYCPRLRCRLLQAF